jgi:lipopolysaccharide/colanic/teichoic acid biosynthesis glycosyltransferase
LGFSEREEEILAFAYHCDARRFERINSSNFRIGSCSVHLHSLLVIPKDEMLQVRIWKRSLDLLASSFGLLLLSPLIAAIALVIKLDSRGPVFFRQERMGRGLQKFVIYKFRTMVEDAPVKGGQLTVNEDARITRFGRILRQTKLDELPQLINVFVGEMSLVGPRPEVARYVELFRSDYEEILRVQPGITDLASLKYRDESALFRLSDDPEREYVTRILPDKIALAKEYMQRSSFCFDVSLIFKTLLKVLIR